MAGGKTSAQLAARDRAREARLRLDAERIKRDEKIDTAVAEYLVLVDERAALLAKVQDVEAQMQAPVEQLIGLGESARRIIALLGAEGDDVRQVRAAVKAHRPRTARAKSGASDDSQVSDSSVDAA